METMGGVGVRALPITLYGGGLTALHIAYLLYL